MAGRVPGSSIPSTMGDPTTTDDDLVVHHGRGAVDIHGLHLPKRVSGVLDVEIGDHRVWSFQADRHDDADEDGLRLIPWPEVLTRFLDGRARVVVREHVSGKARLDVEVQLGSGTGEVQIRDAEGRSLAVTKYGRLNRPFDGADRTAVEGYLDECEKVLAVLRDDCGLPAFISFGTLLGAVRNGRLIGHDVDVDLGYLSDYEHPADVMRESFRVERALTAAGYRCKRENGGFLALYFTQSDGVLRNLDVFACWRVGEWLYQVHDIRERLPRSSVVPLREIELEGRSWPAPNRPEDLLQAAYGPGWRVPDPAFEYTAPRARARRIGGWLGGLRADRDRWMGYYGRKGRLAPPTEPSDFARWAAERMPEDAYVVDLGCGTGGDAVWFGQRGHRVLAVDFVPAAVRVAAETADAAGVPVEVEQANLYDLRHALGLGARLSRQAPVTVYARGLLSDLNPHGKSSFWRLVTMAGVGGGRLLLEFDSIVAMDGRRVGPGRRKRRLDPMRVIRTVQRQGGVVVDREDVSGESGPKCRMMVEWQR